MGNKGILSPKTLPAGRLRVEYIDKEIKKLNIDKIPLLKLLTKVGKTGIGRMEYNWLKKERRSDWGGIASFGGSWGSGANKGGTITITTGEGWKYGAGDVISLPNDSSVNIYVDSVSGDILTCHTYDDSKTINFSAGTTGTNTILNITNSFEEGSEKGTERSFQPSSDINYLQIIQHPFGVVETMQHLDYDVGAKEMDELNKEAIIEHEFTKEKTFFFGQKHKAASGYMDGNFEQFFTGGFLEAFTENVVTESDLTQAEFGNWINDFLYYAKKPVIFAGAIIFEALSWWLGRTLQTQQSEKTLGIAVVDYMNQYGQVVHIIPHRELLKNFYAGYAFGVDLDDVKYIYLNGEDTHLEVGIQNNAAKQEINEYRSWFGCWVGNPKRHGVLKGVTSISA